jgi:FkbM family methyltransferase
MFDLEERPDVFNLKEVVIHNSASIGGDNPLTITTPPQIWAFAATFPLHDDPNDPLQGHQRLIIRADATVEEGVIGFSIASPDCSELISKEDRQGAGGRTTFEVLLTSPRPGAFVAVRNCAAGGITSRIKIHGIRAYLARAREFGDSSGAALVAEAQPGGSSEDLLSQEPPPAEIWLDVGAHLGEKTFSAAADNPRLRVYAFEPNLRVASRLMGQLPNYIALPMAIAEHDGSSTFYLNRYSPGSSLLPFVPEGLQEWVGGEVFQVEAALTVPTMRLDTFLNQAGIGKVAYLKIDTQGCDLTVVRSAGQRLPDIQRISLEVQTSAVPLYLGAGRKEDVISFLTQAGFELVSSEKQSHDQEENLTFIRRAS